MKTQVSSRKNPSYEHVQNVHYLRTGNNSLHKPCADTRGIHCVGDRFGYVVDWQVPEKKREIILTK